MRLAYCPNCRKPTYWVKRLPAKGRSVLASGISFLAAPFQKSCCQECGMSWAQLMERPFCEPESLARPRPQELS